MLRRPEAHLPDVAVVREELVLGEDLLGDRCPLGGRTSNAVQLVLASLVVFGAGWPFLQRGWASLRSRNLNMFTLVMIGTGVAWAYSAVATLAPDASPQHELSSSDPLPHVRFES